MLQAIEASSGHVRRGPCRHESKHGRVSVRDSETPSGYLNRTGLMLFSRLRGYWPLQTDERTGSNAHLELGPQVRSFVDALGPGMEEHHGAHRVASGRGAAVRLSGPNQPWPEPGVRPTTAHEQSANPGIQGSTPKRAARLSTHHRDGTGSPGLVPYRGALALRGDDSQPAVRPVRRLGSAGTGQQHPRP